LLPLGFLEIRVTIETGGNHKERHFQFKALRGDGMNRLWYSKMTPQWSKASD